MARVLSAFLFGLAISFLVLHLASLAVMAAAFECTEENAEKSGRTTQEYQVWVEQTVRPRLLWLTLGGALVCGALCGSQAARWPGGANTARIRSRRQRGPSRDDSPLTRQEFARVLHCCGFVDVSEKGPLYLQGLIVGRLVDSAPELAWKVNHFSAEHMAALFDDVRRSYGIV